jgi:hypothetical protein
VRKVLTGLVLAALDGCRHRSTPHGYKTVSVLDDHAAAISRIAQGGGA